MTYLVETRAQWETNKFWRDSLRLSGRLEQTEDESEEDTVRRNAEWLLEHLYQPSVNVGCCYRGRKARVPSGEWLDVDGFINWGNLEVTGCEKQDDTWQVVLEEASDINLCRYVEEWLTAWGWACKVTAEW